MTKLDQIRAAEARLLLSTYDRSPVLFTGGEGVYITDEQGVKYIRAIPSRVIEMPGTKDLRVRYFDAEGNDHKAILLPQETPVKQPHTRLYVLRLEQRLQPPTLPRRCQPL